MLPKNIYAIVCAYIPTRPHPSLPPSLRPHPHPHPHPHLSLFLSLSATYNLQIIISVDKQYALINSLRPSDAYLRQ